MKDSFYYVTVTVMGKQYFVNRDLDLTDRFDAVRKFPTAEEANDQAKNWRLVENQPKVLHFSGD